ncbi:MAG: hypothetical protein ACYSWU_01605, partial [Planctomycetota bacterium]
MKDDSVLQDTLQQLQTEVTSTPSIVDDVMRRIEQKPMPVRCRGWNRTKVVAVCTAAAMCLAVMIGIWIGAGDSEPVNVASTRGNQAAVQQGDEGAWLRGLQGNQPAESPDADDAARLGGIPTARRAGSQGLGLQSELTGVVPSRGALPSAGLVSAERASGNASLGSVAENAPWGNAVHDVQCRLRPEKSSWKVGQTPQLQADLRNRGKRELSMGLYPTSWEVQYDGVWYHATARFSGGVELLQLKPGDQRNGISLLLEERFGWLSKKNGLRLVFRPGKHTLRAAFMLDGGSVRVVSNPVEIEIVADQPVAGGEKTAWGKPVDGVQCRLLPEKSTWQAGQTPRLQADLRNRGKRDVNLGLAPENWEVQYDGVWYRSTIATAGNVKVLTLKPGAEENGISLQLGDSWGWQSKDKNLALVFRPGRHTLRAAFQVRGVSAPVVSDPVEIEIVGEQPAAGDDETAWGKPLEGVQCRLLPEKSTWKMGQRPELQADLQNRGERDLAFALNPISWDIEYDGVWYHAPDATGFGVLSSLKQGGDKNGISLRLGYSGGWLSKKDSLRLVLRPGKHTLRAAFNLGPDDGTIRDDGELRVVSNPVEIEIVADQRPVGGDETAWGPATEGVQCRLVPEKRTWKAGQTPQLLADLRNRGKRELSMGLYPTSWEVQYDGVWYHATARFSGGVELLRLKPSDQRNGISLLLEDRFEWLSKKNSLRLVFRPGRHSLCAAFHLDADDG